VTTTFPPHVPVYVESPKAPSLVRYCSLCTHLLSVGMCGKPKFCSDSVMRLIVLHPYTNFEVRTPSRSASHSEDMADFRSSFLPNFSFLCRPLQTNGQIDTGYQSIISPPIRSVTGTSIG